METKNAKPLTSASRKTQVSPCKAKAISRLLAGGQGLRGGDPRLMPSAEVTYVVVKARLQDAVQLGCLQAYAEYLQACADCEVTFAPATCA